MTLFLCIVLIIVAIGILAVLKAKQPAKINGLSFEKRDPLFTPAESSFLRVLEQALDNRYRVFGKVRLGDIVKPAKGLSNSKRTSALNKINKKHVDFVVCLAADLAVIGVMELDDKSHAREDRAGRDAFVDKTLADAKIPVAHFSAKKGYAIQEVRAKLVEAFKLAANSPIPSVAMENPLPLSAQPEPLATVSQCTVQPEEVAPACPKCAANMVKRQAKNGAHAGRFFWACSMYPKCRQVVAVEP